MVSDSLYMVQASVSLRTVNFDELTAYLHGCRSLRHSALSLSAAPDSVPRSSCLSWPVFQLHSAIHLPKVCTERCASSLRLSPLPSLAVGISAHNALHDHTDLPCACENLDFNAVMVAWPQANVVKITPCYLLVKLASTSMLRVAQIGKILAREIESLPTGS